MSNVMLLLELRILLPGSTTVVCLLVDQAHCIYIFIYIYIVAFQYKKEKNVREGDATQ